MSKLSDVKKQMKKKDMDFFFGENNYKMLSNKYFTFKQILDGDNIIIKTHNMMRIKGSWVMLVGSNKGVYLKDWQVRIYFDYYNESQEGYLVKLNRKYFKTYTFKSDFEDFYFEKDETFDDLYDVAKEQEEQHIKISLR